MKGEAQQWYRSPYFTMTHKAKLEWPPLFHIGMHYAFTFAIYLSYK